MAAQLSTKLTLDGTQHNDALRNATKELAKYKREVSNTNRELKNMKGANAGMKELLNVGNQLKSGNITGAISSAKSALTALGASAAKLAPAFAVASASIAVYTNHLKHDKVAAEDAELAKRSLTISVDRFSEALARADFSNFLNGLRQQISLAKEAAEATEAAARAALMFSNQYKKASIGYDQAMYEARDPQKTEAERKAALERAKKFHAEMTRIENETSARDASAAYKKLKEVIGDGSIGSNMVAWGMGPTAWHLGKEVTNSNIDLILKNADHFVKVTDRMKEAWQHTRDATDGGGKKSFEWVEEWQKLASKGENVIAYKLFVDGGDDVKEAIDLLNSSYDSDAWQKQREYMMGRTDYKVSKQAESEAKKRAAATAKALKEVKFDPLANTKEGWENNVRALVVKYNKAKTDAERNSIADQIKEWQKKIDSLEFNDNTIKGLQAQLKSVNEQLEVTDIKSEAFTNLKKKAEELQDKIDEINIADITNPQTTREIQQKIQYLQHQLNKLVPNTEEYRKVTKEIQKWNEALTESPLFGSNEYYENEINKLQERLNKEPLTITARIKLQDEISNKQKALAYMNDTSYIKQTQTSSHDDRLTQSYNNAQSNINMILDKLETRMGYTTDDAIKDVAKVNAELMKLGLKPIKVQIQSEFSKELESFMNGTSDFSQIVGGIDGVVGSIKNLNSSLKEGADGWEIFMNSVSVCMSIIQAITTVMEIVDAVQTAMNITTAASSEMKAKEAATHTINAASEDVEAASVAALGIANAAAVAPTLLLATAVKKLAAAQIFQAHAEIPFVGPPAAAAGVATMEATLAAIQAFANGGIVSGKYSMGDRLLVRANKGEMILNNRQQANLFKAIDQGMMANRVQVIGGEVRLRGSDLVIAMKNETKKSNLLR